MCASNIRRWSFSTPSSWWTAENEHTAGIDTHHGSGRQIRDGNARFSDQFFRLVVFVDTGKNHSVSAGSVVQREFQEFFGLFDCLTRLDLDGAEVGFCERLEVHKVLEQRLNFDLGEVDDFLLGGRCGAASLFAASFFGISSGFIVGKRMTSRMESAPVKSMTARSMPMPMPPVGACRIPAPSGNPRRAFRSRHHRARAARPAS